ncbi:hypothetical protein [Budvicia aquatica]|uniref:hypothetical protein n=1 Tax=Budvicia aquatica TaxID=82979 RepID=UPI000FD89FB8|nr:hypothetical protein [Budvicia aquatica]
MTLFVTTVVPSGITAYKSPTAVGALPWIIPVESLSTTAPTGTTEPTSMTAISTASTVRDVPVVSCVICPSLPHYVARLF